MTLNVPVGYGVATVNMALSGKADPMSFTFGFFDTSDVGAAGCAFAITQALTHTSGIARAAETLTSYSWTGVDCMVMTGTGPTVGSYGMAVAGTLSGDPLPPNCAFLVSKQTARGGRKGRGRMFLPPAFYGESGFDGNGSWIGAGQARVQADLTNLLDRLEVEDVPMRLFHNDPDTGPDAVTGLVLNGRIATQRRRLR